MSVLLRELVIVDQSGQDLAEYALLIALIGLVAAGAVGGFGTVVRGMWNTLITMAAVLLQ